MDSYFYQNNFDLSSSQHRRAQVSKGSNKKSFAINLIQFFDLKTEQRDILHEGVNVSKRQNGFFFDSLRDFLKTFDQAGNSLQIPLPKPKNEIESKKLQDNHFCKHCKGMIEYSRRKINSVSKLAN